MPTTKASATSPLLKLPPQFNTFLKVWANPTSSFSPPLKPQGGGYANLVNSFESNWQAGKIPISGLHDALVTARQRHRQPARSGVDGIGAVAEPVVAPVPTRTPVERRRARRRATLRRYGLVAAMLSPWIVGFIAFTAGPMIISLYYSFTHYDLASSPHVDRPRQLQVHVR